jgi:Leucine-rich repeat (LRR) protein
VERITALRLECSDVLFFESSLENNNKHDGGSFLGQLRRLRDLRIEYCKIRYVPSAVLASLRELRHLSLRTHNTDWSAMTMEFHPDSFRGLLDLRSLDLADNNIWTLPPELFCALYSLANLNLSRNRIQDVAELGFSDWGNGPSAPGKSCNVGLEVLDLSANDIILMPDNGLSSLRSLQKLYIQDNSLTSLADRALVGLISLQILNASSNLLVALPPELFQSSRDIKEIYLQNNSISVLAPGLLEGLDQLLVLDLSSNELTNNCVNRDTFSGLVRLVILNLAHNDITRIDSHVFQDLYSLQILNLEENGIDVIAESAFSSLSNLHALTLTHNNLVQLEPHHFTGLYVLNQLYLDNNHIKVIHPRTFENCTNLQDLGISGNHLMEVPDGIGHLRYLKSLDLGDNHISKLINTSFEGLDQLYGLRLINNELVNISRDAFSALPTLQVLNLACNKIEVVDQGAFGTYPNLKAIRLDGNRLTNIDGIFTHLPGLVWLNVSDNQLTWFDYALLPQSLEWLDMHKNQVSKLGNYFDTRKELQIKMLDVSFNKLTEIREDSIPNSVESVFLNDNMIKKVQANVFLKKVNLSRAVLYANDLENLDFSALRLQPVSEDKDLPQFYIGGNPFHCDCNMEWLHRINQLSHLRQHPRIMDLDAVTCRLSYSRGDVNRPLLDLKPSQFLCPYETHCFALCHCCDFDACDCEMMCPENCTCYHDHTWSANVVDCSNGGHKAVPARIPMDATEIYLDGNDLGELGSHVFIGKRKLQVLYLNSSNVAAIHNRTFNGVTSLRILHLENNRLQELRGFEFDQLENLNELYLDHNAITHVGNSTFSTMRSLEVLRLDDNKIVNFSPWQQLAPVAGSLSKVSLDGNAWTCECESVSRLEEWLRDNVDVASGSNPSKMLCLNGNNKKLKENVADFIKQCNKDNHNAVATSVVQRNPLFTNSVLGDSYVPLLAAGLAVVTVVFLASTLIFIFRQDIRLWAHSRYGIRIFSDSAPAAEVDDDRDRLYDAYMVYSIKDEDFISRIITSELEQSGYSMCLHYRDIHHMSGTSYLADSVLSASDASRRIIIVLSLSFLQNEWDIPEFRASLQASLEQTRMALRRKKVVFLLTTDLQTFSLDPDLHILLRTYTVISWGEKRFWEKLRYAMPDVVAVQKNIKKNRKSSSVAVNDLKKKVGRDGESGRTTSKVASARYIATPTSLESWYKYSAMSQPHPQQATAPLHHTVPTPTPTQSTYVSENSSQRTTDHEEEESSTTTNGSHHYEYSDHHNKLSYTAIDTRHPHHRHKNNNHRNHHHHHVYSTIPDSIPSAHPHNRSSMSSGDPTDNFPAAVCKVNNANPIVANGRTYFV